MAGSDRVCLSLRGLDGVHFGYGRMFVSLREALADRVNLLDDAETVVDVLLPNMVKGWWQGQRRVLFTMWETDALPAEFYEHLNQFDLVLVPCEHNRVLFSNYHPNVKTVPLGTDTDFWCPTEKLPNTTIRFLAGGSHWKRKGLDAVVQAWQELQPQGCELVLKCAKHIVGGVPEINNPTITIIQDTMTLEEERDLYRSADCFIAASRGEGWGLMPLQAMCAGIPTILTDTTGHQEFSHLASRLITTTPQPVQDGKRYDGAGNWSEPDVESIKSAITWFIKNRKSATTKAVTNSKKAREYTWGKSAEVLLEAVQPSSKTVTKKRWVQASGDMVEITALRRIQADIGVHHVDLRKGESAKVPVNVRNVLADAGLI